MERPERITQILCKPIGEIDIRDLGDLMDYVDKTPTDSLAARKNAHVLADAGMNADLVEKLARRLHEKRNQVPA